MSRKRVVKDVDGKEVEGTDVDIVESTDRVNEVRLGDGTVLRARLVVTEAIRLTNRWNDEGNPTYIIKSHNIMRVVEAPEEIRKKDR